jgi:uncharacterized protein (TIGR00730 family)
MSQKSICVYCGSQPGKSPQYVNSAQVLGQDIASNKIRLVYGAGNYGIMGHVAKSTADNGGAVFGIIPKFLTEFERKGDQLEIDMEMLITPDMHTRKQRMFEESDAFVAMPGGIGTLEELIEIMTWAQLGRHDKPIVLANIDGFWNPLIALYEHMSAEGFIHTENKARPLIAEKAEDIVPMIMKHWEEN